MSCGPGCIIYTWVLLQPFCSLVQQLPWVKLQTQLPFGPTAQLLCAYFSQPWADWVNPTFPQQGNSASTFPLPCLLLKSSSLFLGALALPLLFTGSQLVLGKPALCFSCSWEVARFCSADFNCLFMPRLWAAFRIPA